MVESKYLSKFLAASVPLRGNRMLIEILPKEELKTKGGLIVAQSLSDHKTSTDMNRADVAVVLAVGPGYYSDDGKDEPMDIQPGNVVLLSRFGLRAYSTFPGVSDYVAETIALCRDTDVHAVWDSIEKFEEYKKAMAANG